MSQIRTFKASTVEAAMELIRRDLGDEAVVLQSREISTKRLLPWTKPKMEVEVTVGVGARWERAAIDFESQEGLDLESLDPNLMDPASDEPGEQSTDSSEPEAVAAPSQAPAQLSALDERLNSIQSMIEQIGHKQILSSTTDVPVEFFDLYAELINVELEEALARDLVYRLRQHAGANVADNPERSRELLTGMVERELHCSGPIQVLPQKQKVVALVGPTGVGKTTTIAKLAANFRLRDGIKMGLVTVDTYRIAAVEQLRTYAEIIDLPMQIVTSPPEMQRAIESFSGMDLILIDTAGRSPRDELKIQELKQLLEAARVDDVHLVLSLTSSLKSLQSTVRNFSAADISSLILTKLDEADTLGSILSLSREVSLPVSYLTTGQNVPDDIEPAAHDRLARLILGRDTLH
jgi:flagellar biosynthesis protein FlhF